MLWLNRSDRCFRLFKMGKVHFTNMKRKKTVITIAEKLRIIEDLENGMQTNDIKVKYKLQSRSTVSSIRRAKHVIKEKAASAQGFLGKKMI